MPEDLALNKRMVRQYNPSVLFATARNRTEFEEKIVNFQPDVVLSDFNLPDMNGLDALLYVREHLDDTPFVFITGILNDEQRVAETILRGASGYLLKENLARLPALLEKVMSENASVLQRREAEWERRRSNQNDLLKAIALLRASDFTDREKITATLQSVFDRLA